MTPSARELLDQFARDPGEATFAPLFDATRDLVYTVCLRVLGGNPEEAEEAFQSTYTRLVQTVRAGEATAETTAEAALARLAHLEADALRKRRQRRAKKETAMTFPIDAQDAAPSPRDDAAQRETRLKVETLVAQLPDTERLAVQFHFFHGMTHQQIADALGENRSTITARIQRGLERLTPMLRRAGLGEAQAVLAALAAGGALAKAPAAIAAAAVWSGATAAAVALPAATGTSLLTGKLAAIAATGIVIAVSVGLYIGLSRDEEAPPATGALYEMTIPGRPGGDETLPDANTDHPVSGTAAANDGDALPAVYTDAASGDVPEEPTLENATDGPPPKLIVTGRVTYTTGAPAEGARVQLVKRDSTSVIGATLAIRNISLHDAWTTLAEVETGRSGEFRIEYADQLPHFTVAAGKDGYTHESSMFYERNAVRCGGGAQCYAADFVLASDAPVMGTVMTKRGEPLAEVTVRARNTSRGSAGPAVSVTGPKGEFALHGLEPGTVEIAINEKEFVPINHQLTAPASNVNLVLQADGATIRGQVRYFDTDAPAAGFEIVAAVLAGGPFHLVGHIRSDKTDGAGRFQIGKLPAGTVELFVESERYRVMGGNEPWIAVIELEEHEIIDDITLYIYTGHDITGTVTHRDTGEPMEGVRVIIGNEWDGTLREDWTGADGNYLLRDAFGIAAHGTIRSPGGTITSGRMAHWNLRAEKSGYALAGGSNIDRNTPPEVREIRRDLQMTPLAFANGIVIDEHERPIHGVAIAVTGPSSFDAGPEPTTAIDGTFRVPIPIDVSVRLKVVVEGYPEVYTDRIKWEQDSEPQVRIQMTPGATVTGQAIDSSGQPMPGVQTELFQVMRQMNTYTARSLTSQRTNLNGRLHYDAIPLSKHSSFSAPYIQDAPNEVEIVAHHPGYHQERRTFFPDDFTGPEHIDILLLRLDETADLSGRVIDTNGNGIEGIDVIVTGIRGLDRRTTTRDGGEFTLRRLPRGEVDLQLHSDGNTVTLPAQPTGRDNVVYTLRDGTVLPP